MTDSSKCPKCDAEDFTAVQENGEGPFWLWCLPCGYRILTKPKPTEPEMPDKCPACGYEDDWTFRNNRGGEPWYSEMSGHCRGCSVHPWAYRIGGQDKRIAELEAENDELREVLVYPKLKPLTQEQKDRRAELSAKWRLEAADDPKAYEVKCKRVRDAIMAICPTCGGDENDHAPGCEIAELKARVDELEDRSPLGPNCTVLCTRRS